MKSSATGFTEWKKSVKTVQQQQKKLPQSLSGLVIL